MNGTRCLWCYVKEAPWLFAIGLLVPAVAAGGTNLAFAYGTAAFTRELTEGGARMETIVRVMLLTMVALVATSLLEDGGRVLFERFVNRTEKRLRQAVFSALLRARGGAADALDRGEVLTRYETDAAQSVNLVSRDLFSLLWPTLLGAGYLTAVFLEDVGVGFLMLGLCAAVMGLNAVFARRFSLIEGRHLQLREDFAQETSGAVRGRATLRLQGAEDFFLRRLQDRAERLRANDDRRTRLTVTRGLTLDALSTACATLTAPLACVLAAQGQITLASVVLISSLSKVLIKHTSGFGTAFTHLKAHNLAFDRLATLLSLDAEQAGGASLPAANGEGLSFEAVTARYGEKVVLRDVNFRVEPGEVVALSGPSGSGKSTLVKALLRLIDTSGVIRLRGADTRTLDLHALRGAIAYVPEHSALFPGTVRENLLCGDEGADDAALQAALCAAAYPDGGLLDEEVGEGGDRFSGGQKQRLSIARALVKDAPFLILDEPTAALDTETEQAFLGTVKALKEAGKGILLITHRNATLAAADRVLYLRDGTVIGG